MRRKKLSMRRSKRMFRRGASRVHKKNRVRVMRGGYRI